MQIFATTPRFILREILPTDLEAMFELDSEPDVHKYLGNTPVKSIEESEKIIQMVRQQYVDNGIGRWAIEDKETKEFVGWVGLKLLKYEVNKLTNIHDIGYRLIKKHWGKGIASETAAVALKYAFENLQLNEIYASAHVENQASNKILTKIGLKLIDTFLYDGLNCNWYKMDKKDYENLQKPKFNAQKKVICRGR
ncbi:MAG: GNAT family N-acetyltransferase [Flavobacteriia bacterium]|jgi:ribosomal-protein-alanine N-acetyltransferase